MTPEEYRVEQALITAAVAAYVARFSTLFVNPLLTTAQWIGYLQLLYPEVERARTESASLARRFHDSERSKHLPLLPRNEVPLVTYDFKTFVANMEPVRKQMVQAQSPKSAVTGMVMQATREVESAGRQQIVRSVEQDEVLEVFVEVEVQPTPRTVEIVVTELEKAKQEQEKEPDKPVRDLVRERLEREIAETAGRPADRTDKSPPAKVTPSGPVRGWARVATGDETCAWCLMLISRGPVYLSAKSAGLDLHDAGAAAAVAEGEDVSEFMNEWHTGCDCKVIPVYDQFDWPGMDAAARALELWVDASLEARSVLADDPGKKYFSRKQNAWLPTTLNREAINALRRRLETGEISTSEFAALAA